MHLTGGAAGDEFPECLVHGRTDLTRRAEETEVQSSLMSSGARPWISLKVLCWCAYESSALAAQTRRTVLYRLSTVRQIQSLNPSEVEKNRPTTCCLFELT
ncbi:hypothetical protein JOB18_044911 [Solea senegalensis]|uniref:Uncharacterized protein n=1 Tax=Solea senegalensis TaxID=28829 RepID=A0AAV6R9C7_SOLSE|nr:hypothetical protein JOB18_044911 [Solea senegalensis]